MMFWLIVGGLVALAIALGILAVVFVNYDGKGDRASGEHHFRADKAQPVTLPLRLPEVPLHRDVLAATFGRGHLFADLNQAHAAYWRRQAPDAVDDLVAGFVPPQDLPGPVAGTGPRAAAVAPASTARANRGGAVPVSRAGELAPHVVAALTRAGSEDTVVTSHDLEPMVGFALFDAEETVDEYVERLFAGIRVGG